MIQKTVKAIAALLVGATLATAILPAPTHAAVEVWDSCKGRGNSAICKSSTADQNINSVIANIVRVMLILLGSVAVIVIIYSGFRYITSSGDAARVSAAKNTLTYAVVGLVVAIFAYVIVDLTIRGATSGNI